MAKDAPQRHGGNHGKAGKRRVVNHRAPHPQVGCFRGHPQQPAGSRTTLSKQLVRGMLFHSKPGHHHLQQHHEHACPARLPGTGTDHCWAMPCAGGTVTRWQSPHATLHHPGQRLELHTHPFQPPHGHSATCTAVVLQSPPSNLLCPGTLGHSQWAGTAQLTCQRVPVT